MAPGIIGKTEAKNNPAGGNWKQGETGQFVASPKESCRGRARKQWETAMLWMVV
jgi:hypothetical protein